MWALIVKTLLIGLWSFALVFVPVYVIVLIEVPSVISLNVRKNDRFGFPFMIVFHASLRQSVVVVKSSLERVLFVVFLSSFIINNWWHFALRFSHGSLEVLLILSLLHEGTVGSKVWSDLIRFVFWISL